MAIGEKLQQLRKVKGLSQEQLAAQINVSRQAVSKWELNEAIPDTNKVIQLSKFFQVSTDYLLTDDYGNDMDTPAVKETSDFLKRNYKMRMLFFVSMGIVAIGLLVSVTSWLRDLNLFPDNLTFVIRKNILPVSIGFIVQIIGVIIFEVFISRYVSETGNKYTRMNFYTMSVWLVLPFPLIYVENILFSYYRRPITFLSDLIYVIIPYIFICSIITFCLNRKMKDDQSKRE